MQPGEVVIVDFGIPIGSEPGFRRPAIILTAAAVLEGRPRTVHVVPVSSNVERGLPTELSIDAVHQPSVAQVHLLTVTSTERIVERTGSNVGPATLAGIRSIAADLLDID